MKYSLHLDIIFAVVIKLNCGKPLKTGAFPEINGNKSELIIKFQ
jgi:hypothetical protein